MSDRIEIVDMMRGLAALSVVVFHYFYNGIANGKIDSITQTPVLGEIARYGYLGVDVFFIISGFVIASSAVGKTARQFVVGRAVRLYPAFWVAMSITACFILVLGGSRITVTGWQFAANTTMVPQLFRQPFVDGAYWTLAYELAFYSMVFVIILARQGRRLDVIMCVWAIAMGAVSLVAPSLRSFPLLGGYFALFAIGAVISAIRRSGWSPLRVAGLAGGVGAALPFQLGTGADRGLDIVIVAVICVGAYGIILATLSARVSALRLPGSRLAGQLTYPLYLLHAYIGYLLISAFADEQNKVIVTLLVIGFVALLAYALHVVVERWMRPVWYPFFDRTIGRLTALADRGGRSHESSRSTGRDGSPPSRD
ncbi:acyltransferase [Microbacterium sp. 3J1]|uniref:acyltransferase family protein n=1 Tax=Microbacterium sp. 3J1 TaxID=861269 RepID=UPI000A9F7F56|nr:acyltransferase [Microbacterium sp. 3J1]